MRTRRIIRNDTLKKNNSGNIKAVLWDLGKVILDFNFKPSFKKLARHTTLSTQDIEAFFWNSGLEVLYDGGKISSFEFYRAVKKALKHTLSYEQFKQIWNDIFTPQKEVIALVRKLSPHYRQVLISNTNAMHYHYIKKKYPVLSHLDKCILSFKEKTRKPDERIYRTAQMACQAKPREIFYVDDRSELTQAARALGFRTFTYKKNPKRLVLEMKKLHIL